MAGSRTLKLSILADVDDLKKKLATANGDVESSSSKLEEFGNKAKMAFVAAAAAAGAYAVKIAVDGVQAAIEDQAAQEKLARTLEVTTGATNAQIKSVEDQILKYQLAYGVSDKDLRPALSRLALSTNDLTKAQDLLSTALDISAATGKPLEAVTNALGKAYDGSNTALAKLGIGLSSAELKSMSFQQVQNKLNETFGGAAKTQAETYQGQIARLGQTFEEAKESIGTSLLPIVQKLIDFVINTAIPKFQDFKKSAIDPVIKAIVDNKDVWEGLYNFIADTLAPFIFNEFITKFKVLGTVVSFIVDAVAAGIRALEPFLNLAIDGINAVIKGINLLKPGKDIPLISDINFSSSKLPTTSASQFVLPTAITPVVTPVTPTVTKPTSDTSTQMKTVGEAVQNATVGVAMSQMATNALPTIQNYINVTGAIDPESTARQIIDLLNQSDARGTGGAGALRYSTQML